MDTLESINRQSDMPKSRNWISNDPSRWQYDGGPWEHEIYGCTNPPSRRGIAREIVSSLMVATVILCFALALGGCKAISPQVVTTEVIKTADGFTIKSPKDVDAAFFQAGPVIYARYKSTGNESAIKAASDESAQRAAAVGKLAEAAANLGKLP